MKSGPTNPTAEAGAKAGSVVGRSIAGAAAIIMVGNLLSRVVALVREQVLASRFSLNVEISLFSVLNAVPTQIYDMLVGGVLSAALIPVFSEHADGDRDEFWKIVSTVITTVVLLLGAAGGLVWLFAPQISTFMAGNLILEHPQLADIAPLMLQLMAGAVLLMGLQGLSEAVLQSQRHFLLPALSKNFFNLGIIVAVLLLPSLGVTAIAVGMVLGAGAQVLLLLPGLDLRRLRPRLDLGHPAVRRIGRLYLPVALGMAFSVVGVTIDRRLTTVVQLNDSAASVMRVATTLIQFALGIIAAAISLATLPTMSRLSGDADRQAFHRTFGVGLRALLLLIVPVLAFMGALALPIIELLFEHGAFTARDTALTVPALLVYLPSLLFAALDQQLIFAFYARQRTLAPNLVQGIAIAAYLIVAFATYRIWDVYGLIAGNVVQHGIHLLCMGWLAQRQFGLLRGQGLGGALARMGLAALIAAGVAWGGAGALRSLVGTGTLSAAVQVLAGGGLGALAYLLLLHRWNDETLAFFRGALLQRLGRRKGTKQERDHEP